MPDSKWIRREIAGPEVARALGIEGDGRNFDCPGEHGSGKRRRSLSYHARSNTFRCFSCHQRALSVIDLVMTIRGCDVGSAIRWLDSKFPGAPRVRIKAKRGSLKRVRTNMKGFTLQELICSPGWRALSQAGKLVLATIFARTPAAGSERGCIKCTYGEILEWTGIRSRATLSGALKELREAGAVKTALVSSGLQNKQGFWLRQLQFRVSRRALRAKSGAHT